MKRLEFSLWQFGRDELNQRLMPLMVTAICSAPHLEELNCSDWEPEEQIIDLLSGIAQHPLPLKSIDIARRNWPADMMRDAHLPRFCS